uniref:MAGUK p55 subfamily member 6 n=1 Tax=Schistosoma haematobium TaxID=6185 RepID=A0A094ZZM5_SCHHA
MIRYIDALSVINRFLDDSTFVTNHLKIDTNDSNDPITDDKDLIFLRKYLKRSSLRHCFNLVDCIGDNDSKSIIERLRPPQQLLRNSLKVLSELWSDLEEFVMRTREKDQPHAHELYDLLADIHIRELLVAYDDIANYRYVNEDFNLTIIPFENNDQLLCKNSDDNLLNVQNSSKVGVGTEENEEHYKLSKRNDETHSMNVHLKNPPHHHYKPDLSESSMESLDYKLNHTESNRNSCNNEDDLLIKKNFEQLKTHSVPNVYHVNQINTSLDIDDNPPLDDNIENAQYVNKINHLDSDSKHQFDNSHRSVSEMINQFELSIGKNEINYSKDKNVRKSLECLDRVTSSIPSDTQKPTSPKTIPENVSRQSEKRHSKTSKIKSPDNLFTKTNSNSKLGSPTITSKKTSTTKEQRKIKNFHGSDNTLRSSDSNHHHHPSKPFRDSLDGTQSLPRNHGQTPKELKDNHNYHHRESIHPKFPQPGVPRVVHLRRDHPGENLGITVALCTPSPTTSSSPPTSFNGITIQSVTEPIISIQRVLAGSLADRQGCLFPGDILLEINGLRVHTLEQVFSQIQQTSSLIDCKLLVQAPKEGVLRSSIQCSNSNSKTKRYVRCLFDYDATKDSLLPTGDVGLSFKSGDVLELVNDQDPNWWQVRSLKDSNSKARLIPSQTLEERRQAFNQEKLQGLRLRSDIWSYEEVVPWPQSKVPCLLLIGPNGVGRRNLKVLLAKYEPKRFAYPMTDTTDSTLPTNLFKVLSKDQMESDVKSGAYVEWGKVNGHYYGIRFSELRKIIANGRTAVLDCQPQSLHLLHQPEFNPCVVFVAAPSFEVAKTMLQEGLQANVTSNIRSDEELHSIIKDSMSMSVIYRHLYSHILVNKNMKESVEKLSRLVSKLERQPCWIPCGWAYELSIPYRSTRTDGSPFIPGSSSLSALGIHDLPPSSRSSALSKSVISEASTESASRLARPPSICNGEFSGRDRYSITQRIYEKHRRAQHEFQHPPIPELDTPSESVDSYLLNKMSTHHHQHRAKSNHNTDNHELSQPILSVKTTAEEDQLTDTELSQTPSNDDDDDDDDDESKITQVENILSDEQQSNVVNINNDNNPSVQPKLELRKVITINKHEEFSSTSSDDDEDNNNNNNVVSI